MMKQVKFIFGVILLIFVFGYSFNPVHAEELRKMSNDPVVPKSSTFRESEILGTLERPQLNTELRWKGPLINNFNSPQSHRTFKKEIFRPVHP